MIEFEIHSSPDESASGNHKLIRDEITIGSSKRADVIIYDRDLKGVEATLYIIDNKCTLSGNDLNIFHVNGKKFTGNKNIKQNDIVKLGNTTFKIISFKSIASSELKHKLTTRYKDILRTDKYLSDILYELEKELVLIQAVENDKIRKQ